MCPKNFVKKSWGKQFLAKIINGHKQFLVNNFLSKKNNNGANTVSAEQNKMLQKMKLKSMKP